MTSERKYSSRGYVHIFHITADAGICFYTVADCLVWLTLFCTLARKYHVQVLAVCIMLNHFHIEARFPSKAVMAAMMQELNSRFTLMYNRQYGLSGPLFRDNYGSSLKVKEQKIRDNFLYINNNPVVKKAVPQAAAYRWNLLAYMGSSHPFSEALAVRRSSRRLCCLLEVVRRNRQQNQPLRYEFFGGLYKTLSEDERRQLVDAIITAYNVLDYEAIARTWGGYGQICRALSASWGNEYDLADDDSVEDYRHYYRMCRLALEAGYDLNERRFVRLEPEEYGRLARLFVEKTGATRKEIAKFLHCPFLERFGIA